MKQGIKLANNDKIITCVNTQAYLYNISEPIVDRSGKLSRTKIKKANIGMIKPVKNPMIKLSGTFFIIISLNGDR